MRVSVGTPRCLCGNSLSHFISSCSPLCEVLTQVTSTLSEALLVFRQIQQTHLFTNLLTVDYSASCDWVLLFSSFASEWVRFRAVVAEVFCRKLCVYLVCDRSQGDGWHNGVYLHSHSLTLPSVWHSVQGDTFLLRDVTGAAAHSTRVHEPWGQSERDYSNWMTRCCEAEVQQVRLGCREINTSLSNCLPTLYEGASTECHFTF